MNLERKFAPVQNWCQVSGMTRSATYLALGQGYLRAIKQPGGRRTLIDVEQGLAWLRSQPAVEIRSGRRTDSQQTAA